jgi:hypothetical protein
MLRKKISMARNARHIKIPQILAIFSGPLGEIGFNAILYPINLNVHLKYQRSILRIICGFITIRTESSKQMDKNAYRIISTIVYCISIALSTIISGRAGVWYKKEVLSLKSRHGFPLARKWRRSEPIMDRNFGIASHCSSLYQHAFPLSLQVNTFCRNIP